MSFFGPKRKRGEPSLRTAPGLGLYSMVITLLRVRSVLRFVYSSSLTTTSEKNGTRLKIIY